MRATLESIDGGREHSFAYRALAVSAFPFVWHFHPEAELTLIRRGHGRRFVGDHIGTFAPGEVVLLGGGLSHTWASSADLPPRRGACDSVVVQFRAARLVDATLPELADVRRLMGRADRGLLFSPRASARAAATLEAMRRAPPLRRLTMLVECLDALARDRGARTLSSAGFRPAVVSVGRGGSIDPALAFLNREYARPVRLDEVAGRSHLSAGAFSRFFRRSTGKSFTDYLVELRVGRACELMIATDRKLSSIAFESGFNNLSNFNRQFRRLKRCTPRAFRDAHCAHWRTTR